MVQISSRCDSKHKRRMDKKGQEIRDKMMTDRASKDRSHGSDGVARQLKMHQAGQADKILERANTITTPQTIDP